MGSDGLRADPKPNPDLLLPASSARKSRTSRSRPVSLNAAASPDGGLDDGRLAHGRRILPRRRTSANIAAGAAGMSVGSQLDFGSPSQQPSLKRQRGHCQVPCRHSRLGAAWAALLKCHRRNASGGAGWLGCAAWRRSSAGQSAGLITRRSVVRAHPPLLRSPLGPAGPATLVGARGSASACPAPSRPSLRENLNNGQVRSPRSNHARLHRVQTAQLPDQQVEAEHP